MIAACFALPQALSIVPLNNQPMLNHNLVQVCVMGISFEFFLACSLVPFLGVHIGGNANINQLEVAKLDNPCLAFSLNFTRLNSFGLLFLHRISVAWSRM